MLKKSARRAKEEKRIPAIAVSPNEPLRSKMEALASEYDLLCLVTEEMRKRGEKPARHLINRIDRRLPAIEGLLSTSEPQNVNDLFIFAVMLRNKLATLRDNAGFLINPEQYGMPPTLEGYQEIAPNVREDVEDLQAMISLMLDGFERVAGKTAKELGIGRIAACNDYSDA